MIYFCLLHCSPFSLRKQYKIINLQLLIAVSTEILSLTESFKHFHLVDFYIQQRLFVWSTFH